MFPWNLFSLLENPSNLNVDPPCVLAMLIEAIMTKMNPIYLDCATKL